MFRERIIRYKGVKITVFFSIDRCNHYAACLTGAPEVFNNEKLPWITPNTASADKVAEVVVSCPTGALHYKRMDGGSSETAPTENTIRIETYGPLYFHGNLEINDQDENTLLTDTRVALCRCGLSVNKPFCDDNHSNKGFKQDQKLMSNQSDRKDQTLLQKKNVATLVKNGPIEFNGPVTIKNDKGDVLYKGAKTRICRCGTSRRMPFCDGHHTKSKFNSEVGCVRIKI